MAASRKLAERRIRLSPLTATKLCQMAVSCSANRRQLAPQPVAELSHCSTSRCRMGNVRRNGDISEKRSDHNE
jgi:hypothetical protein